MSRKANLTSAKNKKNDEHYTRRIDVENELKHYKHHFKNKTVYCNCDDPDWSSFWKYFSLKFESLGLKKLVSVHYEADKPSYMLQIFKDVNNDGRVNYLDKVKIDLKGSGGFETEECIEILKEVDIVVTNPPFSLFREYLKQLMDYKKKFLIIGNLNAVTYKEVFPLIKENKIWLGVTSPKEFTNPEGGITKFGNIGWFTNLTHKNRHEGLFLSECYTEDKYKKYVNYDAIEVFKTGNEIVKNTPKDYYQVMGVPISFLLNFNPDQFEIVGLGNSKKNFTPNKTLTNVKKIKTNGKVENGNAINCVLALEVDEAPNKTYYTSDDHKYLIAPYARILIKRK